MRREQHSPPRRHCSLEACLLGKREVARPCRGLIAIGKAEMHRSLAELAFDDVGRAFHLRQGFLGAELGNLVMSLRMRANGDDRIGGESPDLVPAHDLGVAGCRHVDVVAVGEGADDLALPRFVDAAQPLMDLFESALLFFDRHCRKTPQAALPAKFDGVRPGDDLLEREPPQFAPA